MATSTTRRGGYVATVVDGTTKNYSTLDAYAEYWYVKQYGTSVINSNGDSGIGIGYRSDQRSLQAAPVFVNSSGGDFRLANIAPNYIDTGAAQVYGRMQQGVSPTVWDGQGSVRAQGNAVDAGAYETAGAISATFTLPTAGATSAGVYDPTGKLIRTLWSGVKYPAGTLTAYWNGLNDSGVPMNNGNYTIKLLSNSIQYVWDGAMNNSSPLVGANIQANFQPIQSMVIIGNTAYYNAGYNEGRYQLYKFSLSNINQVTAYAIGPQGINDDLITNIATDGTKLYTLWETGNNTATHNAGLVPFQSYIETFDLNLNVTSSSKLFVGTGLNGATGIAVQSTGSLLFAANSTDNKVYIYNKSTLAAYSTPYLDGTALGWNTLKSIATTPDGDLWVTCKNSAGQWQILRYTNLGGTPTLAATVTGGLVNPIGIAVSVDGNKTLLVADTESGTTVCQQIKAFSPAGTSNGTTLWTLGQYGGYATNGPAITNTKFILEGMIAPQSDGSFWITDLATNSRTMHFSASRTFINDIEYTRSYEAAVDQNNPTRVFQGFVEYKIDYTKAFTQNQGWTPIDNYSYLGTKDLVPFNDFGGDLGILSVATLSNGRTYAVVTAYVIDPNVTDTNMKALVELTSTGLRFNGIVLPNYDAWLNADGSLTYGNQIGTSQVGYYQLPLTGFDASGNPQYPNTGNPLYPNSPTLLATESITNTWDDNSISANAAPYYCPHFLETDNGLLVTYNQMSHSSGMHLGALDPTTGAWQWTAMPGSGPFNGDGNYDTNDWYGGNRVMVSGSNVFVGYNGEGWDGSGQANQYMQYSDDGLVPRPIWHAQRFRHDLPRLWCRRELVQPVRGQR